MADDLPILAFKSARPWEQWLTKHGATSTGVWMRLYKKGTSTQSITYAEALDIALCHGWIDSQKRSYDDVSWIQRFTPRRPKSPWSKINITHIQRLTAAGKMKASGLREVENAKADGRWERAYDSARSMTLPKDFLTALNKHKGAKRFFESLNKTNLYAIAYRLQTAKKPETRARRMKLIL